LTADNPFRQPLRRRNVHYKTYVREATAEGKDAGSNTDFAIGDDYLWIAFDFSIPLAWITQVEPLGPGFLVAWNNPISKQEEWASFCILRTGWGYNRKKRDDLVRRVREAVANAEARPVLPQITKAETVPGCQRCGDLNPQVFDFTWFTCFLAYFISKPDRRLLCRRHGAQRLRMITAYNLVFGNLGLGVFASPMINFRNIRAARQAGAIGGFEAGVWMAVSFWPYALIAAAVTRSLWFAFTF
jgi:hypothetical protein